MKVRAFYSFGSKYRLPSGGLLGLELTRVDLQKRLIYLEAIHQKSGRRSGLRPARHPQRTKYQPLPISHICTT
jgi:hypothetical protein